MQWLAAIASSLALAIAASQAHAQICLHPPSPQGLPGLSGVPQWLTSTADAPPADPTFRNFVSDARWGDAPFEALYPVGAADNPDSAHYRIMLDPTANTLTVSIQSADGSGATTTADFAC